MRSPANMTTIQIDITNACFHSCSNCTRFCGHHEKPFYMDFETFKRAVNSLDEFQGKVGIIGGEPTLHPEFEKFIEYLRDRRVKDFPPLPFTPIKDLENYSKKHFFPRNAKVGLYSALGPKYYKYFELIYDTFHYQLINDHTNDCMHQALLMQRKELGIDDKTWQEKRDVCWIQNTWSAAITPKGAFFCEIAAGLDMLFNGPGGWEVTADWWKRTPEEFGDQPNWCEMCSAAIDVPLRFSYDGRDDVTPSMLEKLQKVNSPKILKGKYVVYNPQNYNNEKNNFKCFESANEYMEITNSPRIPNAIKQLSPRSIEIYDKKSSLPAFMKKHNPKDWVLICPNPQKSEKFLQMAKEHIFNPGCFYHSPDYIFFNINANSLKNKTFNLKTLKSHYPQRKIIGL